MFERASHDVLESLGPPTDAIASLQRVYRERGAPGTAFKVANALAPHPYDAWVQMAREEYETDAASDLPLSKRLELLRAGFQSNLYRFYGFDDGADPDAYLPEFERKAYTGRINDDPDLLDDKARFREYLTEHGFESYLPERFGTITDGQYRAADEKGDATVRNADDATDSADATSQRADAPIENADGSTIDDLLATLEREGALVIKRTRGAAGGDVYVCEWTDDGIVVNGTPTDRATFRETVASFDSHVVQSYVEQADYLDAIYPDAANTARILTMDPEDGEPFVAIAVQRLGAAGSGGLDNFSQGGLVAEIDRETGELGPAADAGPRGGPRWHAEHPDTGAQIQGVEIPEWPAVREELLEIVAELPEIRYAGWDLLVTEPGEFAIVEANNRSDVDLLQVHRPLLAEDRVREFYAANGVPV